jgi:hypothetical protein
MTTAIKAARPRSAHRAEHNGAEHNGAEHNGAEHNAVEHNGAEHNGTAATEVALAWLVTETVVAALTETSTVAGEIIAHTTVAVESAAGKSQELFSGGFGAGVRKVTGLTVDAYQRAVKQQLDWSVALADAVKVGWVSELTRRNANAIGELVAVSASAAHEMLH